MDGVELHAAGELLRDLVADVVLGEVDHEGPHARDGMDRVRAQGRALGSVGRVLSVPGDVAVGGDEVGADRVTSVVGQRDVGGDVPDEPVHVELVELLLALPWRPAVAAGQGAREAAAGERGDQRAERQRDRRDASLLGVDHDRSGGVAGRRRQVGEDGDRLALPGGQRQRAREHVAEGLEVLGRHPPLDRPVRAPVGSDITEDDARPGAGRRRLDVYIAVRSRTLREGVRGEVAVRIDQDQANAVVVAKRRVPRPRDRSDESVGAGRDVERERGVVVR